MLLQLDFNSERPIYQQIRDQIVVGMARGQLRPGEKLPTVRALADEAGVNMMTVSKAYQLLKQEGGQCPRGSPDRAGADGSAVEAGPIRAARGRVAEGAGAGTVPEAI